MKLIKIERTVISMARTINDITRSVTEYYISHLNFANPPTPGEIELELVTAVKDECILDNHVRSKGDMLRPPTRLCPMQIAMLMLALYPIVRVESSGSGSDPDYDLLAIYQPDGENEGIYVTDESVIKRLATEFNYTISLRELNDVVGMLLMWAPRVKRTVDRDLIAVNNGIFNYETKQLMPFDPKYVLLAKSKVDYNPTATNVVIHNPDDGTDWDVESWMSGLSDDHEIVELLWQILSAIIRPHVRWNKSAWFYSNTGNNGKGTLCELMRSLCGEGSYACIPLCDFAKDFALEPLVRTTAIIVDENDVGTFIDKAANLKAVITNDVISINRKFKTPISYQFYGFMVQCLNEFPRIKDKSDSFYRRQLFIPFDKCFTGKERKYIKNDYLHRKEVLEYVLYRVLTMNFYTLSEPASCRQVLDEYKDFNDPVRQFIDEMMGQLVWDLVPFTFLYDLYKAWFRRNSPSGSIQGKNTFTTDVLNLLSSSSEWYCKDKQATIRTKNRMDRPELLIVEYGLTDWMSKTYKGSDPTRIATPTLNENYRGLLRRTGSPDE